jgi:hypothetical protein
MYDIYIYIYIYAKSSLLFVTVMTGRAPSFLCTGRFPVYCDRHLFRDVVPVTQSSTSYLP